MSSNRGSASKGILAGIIDNGKNKVECPNEKVRNKSSKESKSKRSYTLNTSTIKKLQELRVFVYDDPDITYNEIVDEAICLLYKEKKI